MIVTNQTDNAYDYNYIVVDVIHTYVKTLVLSGDEQLCYPLTKMEKENNDFGIVNHVPLVKQTGSPIVVNVNGIFTLNS